MCYTYTITFPGCRAHKVTTLELCNDRLGEQQRLASRPTSFCGLFGSGHPKERKVCTPEPRFVLRNEPCTTCRRLNKNNNPGRNAYRPPQHKPPPPPGGGGGGLLNERQMQSMLKLQETYRGKAAAAAAGRSSSVYSSDNYYGSGPRAPRRVAAPVRQGYAKRPLPSYLANKPLPPLPLRTGGPKPAKPQGPRRPRRSTAPPRPMGPVRYDDEPVPDDDFIDMAYTYNR